ncbi:MAG: hypothetical protein ACKVT0_24070 [Planctomycetaceae bacterium]
MARQESDREDLFAEAVAFVRKIELRDATDERPETIVAGYRRNGLFTVYLSPDEMYQFTESLLLRRAFADGAMYRTQGSTLAKLTRYRTADVSELLRIDLASAELATFIERTRQHLDQLLNVLENKRYRVVRQFPENEDLVSLLTETLRKILRTEIRLAPALPTKPR